jgi:hypothetical protein
VSRRLTVVATDADGIGGEEGLIRVTPVTFDLDGQSHEVAFHALHWCGPEDCVDRASFQVAHHRETPAHPSVAAYPITVRWTLESVSRRSVTSRFRATQTSNWSPTSARFVVTSARRPVSRVLYPHSSKEYR